MSRAFDGSPSRELGGDLTTEYREWRMVQGLSSVCDVDQIEYRWNPDGTVRPVALVELCVCEWGPAPSYLSIIEDKLDRQRPQGTMLRLLSRNLGVPLLAVVYARGCLEQSGLWVREVTNERGDWLHLSLDGYRAMLARL